MKKLYRRSGLWQVETFSKQELCLISGLDKITFYSPLRIKLPSYSYNIIVEYDQHQSVEEGADIEFIVRSGFNFEMQFLVIAKGFNCMNSKGRLVAEIGSG
jgi:hypothetical protein